MATLIGLAIGAGVCLAITVVEWGAWALVVPGRRRLKTSSGDLEGQAIQATALDGTRLAGTWFSHESTGPGRTILLLHGLAEDRSAILGRVPRLLAHGWNVAALDARASGQSQGRRGTFGIRESDDLIAWLQTLGPLTGRTPRFAAWGRSMGASTALKAASTDPRLRALILEAPYRDLKSAVAAVLRRFKIPIPGFFARLILFRARSLAGVALDRPRPIDLATMVNVPVLIVHGAEDRIAPIADARALAAAFARPAEVLEVQKAGHANVVEVGGDPLMDRVALFLNASVVV